MTACARCSAETAPAELLSSPSGDSICRQCSALEQNAAADAPAQPVMMVESPQSPVVMITVSAVAMALGVFWLCAGYFLGGKVFVFPFLLFAAGLFVLRRGLQLRRR